MRKMWKKRLFESSVPIYRENSISNRRPHYPTALSMWWCCIFCS